MDRVFCTDCLEWMRLQPDNSVDLVFGSPPYENSRTYGIDFKLKGQDWVDWMVVRTVEAVRICKGLVAFIVEGKTNNFRWSATPALLMADLHRAGINLRKPPAFTRVGVPGSGGPDWLRNDFEFVVCCSTGQLPWSDNTAMGHTPKWAPGGERRNEWGSTENTTGMQGRKKNSQFKTRQQRAIDGEGRLTIPAGERGKNGEVQGYIPPKLANPGNVIKCIVGGGVMGSRLCHENEAPFPESLAEFFVLSFCPPTGVVYDPFSGSGTTAAVAKRLGRDFRATDVRQSQVELTLRRIVEVQLALA